MSGTRRCAGPTASPFVLDGLPGTTPRRPRSVAGRGRAFGACCFAGKLRSPAGPARCHRGRGGLTPTSFPTSFPTPPVAYPSYPACPHLSSSCPLVGPVGRKNRGRLAPLGGVERALGKVRFARLIHSGARVLGGPSVRAAGGGNLNLTQWPLRVCSGRPHAPYGARSMKPGEQQPVGLHSSPVGCEGSWRSSGRSCSLVPSVSISIRCHQTRLCSVLLCVHISGRWRR